MKKIFFASLIMMLFAVVSEGYAQKSVPSVNVKTLNNETVNINKYAQNGKITVISFWATWCSPCKKELNNIADMYEEWQEEYDMEIVAVSLDDARNQAKVKTYVNGQGWEYEVLLDANQELKRAMSFQSIPYTVMLDQEGNIVYTHSGYIEGDEFELEEKIAALVKK